MPYKVLTCGVSDVGLVRKNNEDVWAQLSEEQFFVIADGMGGHQAGEVASREAANQLCSLFKQRFNESDKSLQATKNIFLEIIQEVNRRIFQLSLLREGLRGMGTTLCCLFLHPDGLLYAHVGDSRIYRFRDGKLKQLTQDHSLVRELIDLGQLEEQQASEFQYKNIITRAIGTEPHVEPSIKTDTLSPGDIFLMCTDGLTDMLSQEDIQTIIQNTSIQNLAQTLVAKAKEKGGYDNITVVILNVQEKYEAPHLS